MQIDIPSQEAKQLAQQATAAGFPSVEKYVTELLLTLAERPHIEQLFPPLSPDDLEASLSMIDLGRKQIAAGEGMSVEEARRRSLELLGVSEE